MDRFGISDLEKFDGKTVIIRSTEGEVIKAKVTFVSKPFRDITFDLLETNQPERYASDAKKTAYVIPWEYISDIKVVLEGTENR
ncbi:MAG TPA: hypothetical protein VIE13_11515 [Terriglobales bacterium]|jgi:hypothetical protein